MSAWEIFSDADADARYKWRQINNTSDHVIKPLPTSMASPLPSMYDLLLHASTSHLFQPQDEENAIDESYGFSNSLFKTGSGRKVTLSSNGLVRAKTLLGFGLQEEIIDSNNHTPKNAKKFHGYDEKSPPFVSKLKNGFENKIVQIESDSGYKKAPIKFQTPQSARSFNAFEEESPHLQFMKSCKMTSAASFQSPLVGRSKSGFENVIVQPDSGSGAKQTQVKFQTAGGRSITISNDALKRARSLLDDPDLGDFFDGEDSLFLSLDMRQTSKITSSIGHPKIPESNQNHVTKSFTYPLQPSRQTEFSNKLLGHEGNGNNLIMKFDDVANESDYGCKSSNNLRQQKPLYNMNEVVDLTRKSSSLDGFSSRMDSCGKPSGTTLVDVCNSTKTAPTYNKQPTIGKRTLGLTANVSSFKKPRISKTSASGDQHVQKFHNGLSKLSSGASGCKRKVSTRYPSRHARIHIKEFFAVPPLKKKVHFLNPVRQVTSGNAGEYIFYDGGEAFIHLLAQKGASLHFASKEWVLNHYKWIVWKLACYERYYPARCAGKFLTVSNVLEELKYRYEREVNHGHRSIIKKVLEGDIPPSSMMILCISSIHSNHVIESGTLIEAQTGNKSREAVKVELTDGWYSINAILDVPLSKQLDAGRLFVGQKLRIWGAGLCGWNGPVSPFEVSSTVSLFLHINGTYRVHWSERLGFCKVVGPPLAFKCIKNNGGLIPQTLAGITRIYPILYKERLSSGRSVVLSERMENKMMELHNQRRSAVVDNIVSEYQKERTSSHVYDHDDSEGAKIYMMLETASEPEFLMVDMTPEQLRSFAAYKAKLNATRQSQMECSIEKALKDSGLGNRYVTPFMKLRVVGLTYKNRRDKPKEGIVTIWNPTQKQCQELAEGEAYAIAGLTPYGSDSDVLRLQTRGSTTKWLPLSFNAKEQFRSFFNSRKSISLSSLFDIPLSNEFDIVAFVVHVGKAYTSYQQKKQWVFVTDGSMMKGLQSEKFMDTLLAICFCSPLIDHDSFPPINHNLIGSTVGFCNLIKNEKDYTNQIWVADANENSTYYLKFDSPHCSHLRNPASSLTRWASNSSLIIQKLKERLLCIIGDCKT